MIKAPAKAGERPENETEKGLRVQDKGFLNTAVMQSKITYIDGDAGGTSAFDPPSCHHQRVWGSFTIQVRTLLLLEFVVE